MKCEKFIFTKEKLDALISSEIQYEVADTKIDGLRLRSNPGGSKTFNLYRKINGQQIRFKIGRFPETSVLNARNIAIEIIAKFNSGENPQAQRLRLREEFTFKDLWEIYYKDHALTSTKRPNANKKMIEKHVLPKIGNIRASQIQQEKIKAIHSSIWQSKFSNPEQKINYANADRIITIVSSVFNYAANANIFKGTNPCKGVKKNKHLSRDRFLSSDELRTFFSAVEEEEQLFRDFFLALLYTGARKSNVLSMKWADIDFTLKRWRIPEANTKNKDVNIVILSGKALEILCKRKEENSNKTSPSEYVFPSNRKEGYLKDPKKAFQRIRDRMKVQDIRMHDLRRTLGSYMAISGISLPIIGKALNHKSHVSTAIYARLSQNPIEDAVNIAANVMTDN